MPLCVRIRGSVDVDLRFTESEGELRLMADRTVRNPRKGLAEGRMDLGLEVCFGWYGGELLNRHEETSWSRPTCKWMREGDIATGGRQAVVLFGVVRLAARRGVCCGADQRSRALLWTIGGAAERRVIVGPRLETEGIRTPDPSVISLVTKLPLMAAASAAAKLSC